RPNMRTSYSYLCFFFFRREALSLDKNIYTCFSLKERLPFVLILVCFFTNSFRSVQVTIAVASRVSLSDFGFLCSLSMSRSVSSSPLKVKGFRINKGDGKF
uniref:Uncharacterized protein n=1 Tax=Cyprinodon variegatus TaxID=28743 RepID=A0A3Q2E945_CYPVA